MPNKNQSICKIYSRNRIKIFKHKKHNYRINREKKGSLLVIFIIIVITVTICFIFEKSINQVFETICLDKAKSVATKITNEQSTRAIENYHYDDLFKISKDSNRKYKNDKCQYSHNR